MTSGNLTLLTAVLVLALLIGSMIIHGSGLQIASTIKDTDLQKLAVSISYHVTGLYMEMIAVVIAVVACLAAILRIG